MGTLGFETPPRMLPTLLPNPAAASDDRHAISRKDVKRNRFLVYRGPLSPKSGEATKTQPGGPTWSPRRVFDSKTRDFSTGNLQFLSTDFWDRWFFTQIGIPWNENHHEKPTMNQKKSIPIFGSLFPFASKIRKSCRIWTFEPLTLERRYEGIGRGWPRIRL